LKSVGLKALEVLRMMQKVVLKASKRDVIGKQVGALRRAGKLPAVLYGHLIESTPIMLDAHETSLTLSKLTSSSLVTVDLDGTEYPSLVRQKQRDPLKNRLLHLDFQVISLTEKIRTKIGIELIGKSPAVKDFNAVIVTGLTELEVECMPQDLPERILVDITGLAEIGSGIHVRDIVLSEKVAVLDDRDEMIAVASATKEEPVVEAAPVEAEAEPEVVESGLKEKE
jgi:large subunit ribosomal protein L25